MIYVTIVYLVLYMKPYTYLNTNRMCILKIISTNERWRYSVFQKRHFISENTQCQYDIHLIIP